MEEEDRREEQLKERGRIIEKKKKSASEACIRELRGSQVGRATVVKVIRVKLSTQCDPFRVVTMFRRQGDVVPAYLLASLTTYLSMSLSTHKLSETVFKDTLSSGLNDIPMTRDDPIDIGIQKRLELLLQFSVISFYPLFRTE